MFEDIFYNLLEADLIGAKEKPTTRQQRGFIGLGAKTQKLVPDVHRPDPELHPKVELLRNKPFGKQILNDKDLKEIMDLYNIKNISPEEPRELGTTKITLYYDGPLQRYCLKK